MVVDGIELLRMIRDGELKNGDKVQAIYNNFKMTYFLGRGALYSDELIQNSKTEMHVSVLMARKFEILTKEDKEIDIQAIEEFEIGGCNVKMGDTWVSTESLVNDMLLDKTNQLIKAVKQLDKKIK